MKAIFVTGTDTGVGKTVVTGCLARFLKEKGYAVITQKWIETGCEEEFSRDVMEHLKIMGSNIGSISGYLRHVSPYVFTTASSPHLASSIEKRKINADKIIKSFKLLSGYFDFVIVEGVGGALVPLDKKRLVIDIARHLDLPVLVVAQNKLGAINHTLLTIEALQSRRLKVMGIVFNNSKGEKKEILRDNPRIIKSHVKQQIFGILPWVAGQKKLYRRFIPIGEAILKGMASYG